MIAQLNADDLSEGDKVTMDGLKVCEITNTDATRGLGDTREGFELRDVEKDGEDDLFFKQADQLELRWPRME